MKEQKLFCIPYAGGSADIIYTKWKKHLDSSIKMIPIEYSGHGRRVEEALNENIEELVNDLFETVIESEIKDGTGYMIYGHSMGTLVVYELLKLVKANNYSLPHTIFLSGRYSPDTSFQKEGVYLLSDKQLIDKLVGLGGASASIYDYPELIKAHVPIIRNDYKLIDQYNFVMPISSFNSDLIFIYSDSDPYLGDRKRVDEWRQYTDKDFAVVEVEGNHFFINEKTEFICTLINNKAAKF